MEQLDAVIARNQQEARQYERDCHYVETKTRQRWVTVWRDVATNIKRMSDAAQTKTSITPR